MAHKRDLMLVGGGRLATAFVALLTLRAATAMLTPEQYGELALIIAVQMFCGLFFVNPVGQYVNLHTHAWWDDGTLLARMRSYRRYILAVSMMGGMLVIGMYGQHAIEYRVMAAVALFMIVMAGTWNATWVPMLNMLGFRGTAVLWGIITVMVGLASSILLVIGWPSAIAWIGGQAIGLSVGAIGASHVLHRHAKPLNFAQGRLPLLDKQAILKYCLPLAIGTGFMWLQLSGYRFLIEKYWGLAQLGFLAIGLAVAGQIAALVESFVMQFAYPYFFRRISGADVMMGQAALSDLLNVLGPSYVLLAGAIVLAAPHLLLLLVDMRYADAVMFVSLGAAIEGCRMLGNLAGNASQITRQTFSLAVPYAMGALTVWGLIIGFGEKGLPIDYAGWSLVAGAVMMLLMMMFVMYRQVRFRIAPLPWAIATLAMLAMVMFGIERQSPTGMFEAAMKLAGIAVIVCVAQVALLWKNPAMTRLFNVQLRKT